MILDEREALLRRLKELSAWDTIPGGRAAVDDWVPRSRDVQLLTALEVSGVTHALVYMSIACLGMDPDPKGLRPPHERARLIRLVTLAGIEYFGLAANVDAEMLKHRVLGFPIGPDGLLLELLGRAE